MTGRVLLIVVEELLDCFTKLAKVGVPILSEEFILLGR